MKTQFLSLSWVVGGTGAGPEPFGAATAQGPRPTAHQVGWLAALPLLALYLSLPLSLSLCRVPLFVLYLAQLDKDEGWVTAYISHDEWSGNRD